MVNSQLVKEEIDILKLDLQTDKVPSPIPVVEVNPKMVSDGYVKAATRTTTGGVTALTVPAKGKLFITSCTFSMVKNVACDVPTGVVQITGTKDGNALTLAEIPVLTLTAERQTVQVIYKNPILIDKNTTISITTVNYAAGLMVRNVILTYYVDEVA